LRGSCLIFQSATPCCAVVWSLVPFSYSRPLMYPYAFIFWSSPVPVPMATCNCRLKSFAYSFSLTPNYLLLLRRPSFDELCVMSASPPRFLDHSFSTCWYMYSRVSLVVLAATLRLSVLLLSLSSVICVTLLSPARRARQCGVKFPVT